MGPHKRQLQEVARANPRHGVGWSAIKQKSKKVMSEATQEVEKTTEPESVVVNTNRAPKDAKQLTDEIINSVGNSGGSQWVWKFEDGEPVESETVSIEILPQSADPSKNWVKCITQDGIVLGNSDVLRMALQKGSYSGIQLRVYPQSEEQFNANKAREIAKLSNKDLPSEKREKVIRNISRIYDPGQGLANLKGDSVIGISPANDSE